MSHAVKIEAVLSKALNLVVLRFHKSDWSKEYGFYVRISAALIIYNPQITHKLVLQTHTECSNFSIRNTLIYYHESGTVITVNYKGTV